MKMPLLILILAATAACHAQDMKAWPDACGKDAVQFKVKTEKSNATNVTPGGWQGDDRLCRKSRWRLHVCSHEPVRYGWQLGRCKQGQFLRCCFDFDPGTHHLCASRQSSIHDEKVNVGLVTLNAEAGKVYFYEFTIKRTGDWQCIATGRQLPCRGSILDRWTAKSHPTVRFGGFSALSAEEGQTGSAEASSECIRSEVTRTRCGQLSPRIQPAAACLFRALS